MTEESGTKDLSARTEEERSAAWESWIRDEVNSVLDIYLPFANKGFVKVEYTPHVIERLENGDALDITKADSVSIRLVFEFGTPIDLTQPRPASS